MKNHKIYTIILLIIIPTLIGFVAFKYAQLQTIEKYNDVLATMKAEYESEIEFLNQEMNSKDTFISQKNFLIEDLLNQKNNLHSEVDSLSSRVAGMSTEQYPFPFAVPSTGYLGHIAGSYGGTMNGDEHLGVDIWTSIHSGGAISTHKGNPVYSACDGVVDNFQLENGAVTILCDPIPDYYNVPAHEGVRTYYGHMGNAITQELYIYVKHGQRVQRGEFIGYQGDLSSFTPNMRNVHLHFSVFTGLREKGGAKDPCMYIGGDCKAVGRFFINNLK